ncbi:MAG: hypothetical protein D6701_12320, partial [Gemmatimonadetes bacterium]
LPSEGLDRLLERVPGLRLGGPSSITLDGELAVSLPNPNTRGDAFLDDFDAADRRSLSLFAYDWARGSAPTFRDGVESVLPPGPDATNAADLVWQHTWVVETPQGDSLGVFEGFLPRVDIDQKIQFAGSQVRETGLLLSFDPGVLGGGRRAWRSITTTLSATGLDLSKSEFLEFYAAGGESLTLVIDLGTVSEDAVFVDAEGRTSGVKSTGVPWGLGLLDQEADPLRGEVWSTALDEVGVWGEDCLAEPAAIYRIGDPRANCTRGNGRRDSEDLDGDGALDRRERYLRFVVELDGRSPYLARTRDETGTEFRLYRIPIRGTGAIGVPGPFTEADFRTVKHMRLTLAGSRRERLTLARMRIVGSRWVKRADSGVLTGIVGDTAALFGRMEVGPVSRLTEGAAYQPPPGVLEELDDPSSALGPQGVEFNEKGLKLSYVDVPGGGRAEVFSRFPQRPRDFLAYRELRLWAVAPEGEWGPDQRLFLFVKVGEDAENFYLYRTPLPGTAVPGQVQSADWLPEVRVDFGEWFDLRQRAEEALIAHPRGPGDPPLAIWGSDSTYAVVLKDRARAPNLAAVREMSIGVWNELDGPTSGELWVNELRLGSALTDGGVATHVALDVQASDVMRTRVRFSSRGGQFRQLEQRPTFQTDRAFDVSSRVRLDRFAPADWGVEIPLQVTHSRTGATPDFLERSDVRVDRLDGVREPGSTRTRVDVAFRKATPTSNPWVGLILDGLEARAGYFRAHSTTITSRAESEGFDARLGYGRILARRDVALVPDFLEPVVRWLLPAGLEDRVAGSRLRWSPERVSVATTYGRVRAQALRFDRIVELPGDTAVRPVRTPRENLQSAAEVVLRPLASLSGRVNLTTVRDLLPPPRVVTDPDVQDLVRDEVVRAVGLDFGWETSRVLRTNLDWEPDLAGWLRGAVSVRTFYTSNRNATFVERRVEDGDTVLALERDVDARRDWSGRLTVLPQALPGAGGDTPWARFTRLLRPLSLRWQGGLSTRFNRDAVDPDLGYQFGFGAPGRRRVIEGDTAATLTDRDAFSASGGVALGNVLSLDMGYRSASSLTLDTRSDRTVEERTWPDVTARLAEARAPAAARRVLERVGLSAGVRRTRSRSAVWASNAASPKRSRCPSRCASRGPAAW